MAVAHNSITCLSRNNRQKSVSDRTVQTSSAPAPMNNDNYVLLSYARVQLPYKWSRGRGDRGSDLTNYVERTRTKENIGNLQIGNVQIGNLEIRNVQIRNIEIRNVQIGNDWMRNVGFEWQLSATVQN